MLEEGGIPLLTDRIRRADEDNPEGYYEFERVKKLPEGDFSWLSSAQGKAVKIIAALLPYLPDGYRYQMLFIQREIAETIASQKKMLLHRGEDPDAIGEIELARLYKKHLSKISLWFEKHPQYPLLSVNYNEIMSNPTPSLERIVEFLPFDLNLEKMRAVINPKLYRQRLSKD